MSFAATYSLVLILGYDGCLVDKNSIDESDQDNTQEQRANVRVQVEAFVKVDHQSEEWVLRTRDLSKSGLFLYTKVAHIYPFTVGSTLQIELYDYNTFVSCRVAVVRVVDPNSAEAMNTPVGFGVQIIEISDSDQIRLDSILHRVTQGESLY